MFSYKYQYKIFYSTVLIWYRAWNHSYNIKATEKHKTVFIRNVIKSPLFVHSIIL